MGTQQDGQEGFIVRSGPIACVAVLGIVVGVAGCSRNSAKPAESAAATAPLATVTLPQATAKQPTACELVTAAEMSAILGTDVTGTDEGDTACSYRPATGSMPALNLQVDWGSASAAMMASGMMSRIEPGIANPLEGLGDKAAQIGPALWVQVGEDLVTITMMGVDDRIAKAKRIVDTARPRFPKAS